MRLTSAQQVPKRKTYLDFLRIIAIYMVLFNHTGTKGFTFFTISQYSKLYPLYLFIAVFIKIAVPLFFMISGALLLDKDESFKDLLTKRFLKYLVVLICASLNLYIYSSLRMTHTQMSVSDFLKSLYSGKITVAYWYLYAYLAFILMLPLLRKLARGMTNRDFKWVILLCTIVGLLSMLEYFFTKGTVSYNKNFSLFVGQNYILYPLMGYFIERRLKPEDFTRKNLLILWILSLLAIAASCFMTHYKGSITGDWRESTCQTFFNTLIFIPAITVFYTVKMWFMKHTPGPKTSKIISTIGGLTFGIYLIERICRVETEKLFFILKPYIHTLPSCLVWIFAACVFGGVFIFILKKIPGVKKFI